jgi:hypothetical protein
MDNQHVYGFRWAYSMNGAMPQPIEGLIASGYQATNDGAGFNVDLNIGDPVKPVSDGSWSLAKTTEKAGGIIVGFKPYWNGTFMQPNNKLPGGTAGGTTILDRFSYALICPIFIDQWWEIDCDDSSTATTYATYQALIHENVSFVVPGNQTPKLADPLIDISTHNTTAALELRIRGISQNFSNQDFSGLYVKLMVSFNNTSNPGQPATNIAGV